ncbi:MAG: hypothetical protein SGPRY_010916 [Prymnesium sp.]
MRNARKTPVCASPSLLFSNLATDGSKLAFAHNAEVVLAPAPPSLHSSTPLSYKIPQLHGKPVLRVRWVGHSLLAVGGVGSLQIYSADDRRLLFSLEAPEGGQEPPAFPSIGGEGSLILAGTSAGSLCVVKALSGEQFTEAAFYQAASDPIVDLSSKGEREGEGAAVLIATADGGGGLSLFRLGEETWERCAVDEGRGREGEKVRGELERMREWRRKLSDFVPEEGEMCTVVRMQGSKLYSAFSSGCKIARGFRRIRIFEVEGHNLLLSTLVAAHARWINALEVHPSKPIFASAAEDSFVSVWAFEPTGKLSLRGSSHAPDSLMCGLAFCEDHLAATAYDHPSILTWAF